LREIVAVRVLDDILRAHSDAERHAGQDCGKRGEIARGNLHGRLHAGSGSPDWNRDGNDIGILERA
jgi:hypothetical protein